MAEIVPPEFPLTSFSILFARHKGDLAAYAEGAAAIDHLADGDRILIAEACTHTYGAGRHRPHQAARMVAVLLRVANLHFDYVQGHDFPPDLTGYRLVIQCGGCMVNRREILARQERALRRRCALHQLRRGHRQAPRDPAAGPGAFYRHEFGG